MRFWCSHCGEEHVRPKRYRCPIDKMAGCTFCQHEATVRPKKAGWVCKVVYEALQDEIRESSTTSHPVDSTMTSTDSGGSSHPVDSTMASTDSGVASHPVDSTGTSTEPATTPHAVDLRGSSSDSLDTSISLEDDTDTGPIDFQNHVEQALYGHPIAGPEELVQWVPGTRGPCAIVLCKGDFMKVVWCSKASQLKLPDERRKLIENFQYLLHIVGIEAQELVEYEEDDSFLSTPSSCAPAYNQELECTELTDLLPSESENIETGDKRKRDANYDSSEELPKKKKESPATRVFTPKESAFLYKQRRRPRGKAKKTLQKRLANIKKVTKIVLHDDVDEVVKGVEQTKTKKQVLKRNKKLPKDVCYELQTFVGLSEHKYERLRTFLSRRAEVDLHCSKATGEVKQKCVKEMCERLEVSPVKTKEGKTCGAIASLDKCVDSLLNLYEQSQTHESVWKISADARPNGKHRSEISVGITPLSFAKDEAQLASAVYPVAEFQGTVF
jgi:hypothetical protein